MLSGGGFMRVGCVGEHVGSGGGFVGSGRRCGVCGGLEWGLPHFHSPTPCGVQPQALGAVASRAHCSGA